MPDPQRDSVKNRGTKGHQTVIFEHFPPPRRYGTIKSLALTNKEKP